MVTNKFIIKIMLALFGNLANGIQENETFSVGGEIAGLIAEYIDSERSTVQYGDLDTINKFIEKELSFRPLSNEEKSRIKENLLNYLVYNFPDFKTIVQCNNDAQELSKILCNGFSEHYRSLATYEMETCHRCLAIIAEVYIQMAQKVSDYDQERWKSLFYKLEALKRATASIKDNLERIVNTQGEILNRFDEFVQYIESTDFVPINQLHEKHRKYVEFENRYLEVVARKYNVINLFASLIHRNYKRYNLSVAYVGLWLEKGEHDAEKVNVDELLNGNNKIWVAGDPGYGKTTLLQWMAVNFAERKFLSTALKYRIPVFFTLRNIENWDTFGIEQAIKMDMSEIECSIPDGWIVDMLNGDRFVLLIDGMDEISSRKADIVRDKIESLAKQYENLRLVISARTYIEENLAFPCKYVRIKKMDEDQIWQFIDYWHNSVLIESGILDSEGVRKYKDTLYNSILSVPAILKLAEVPLACAMLCALNFCRNNSLPHTRRQLYEDCCRMFLEIDPQKDIGFEQYPNLSIEKYSLILDGLAYWMVRNNCIEAKIDVFERQIKERLQFIGIENVQERDVVKYLTERSGIIRQVGVDSVEFIHNTFMEFMAARELHRLSDWGILQQHFEDNKWQEIILLVGALANKVEAEKLIENLLNISSPIAGGIWMLKNGKLSPNDRKKLKTRRYFIAKACMENIQIIDKSYRDRVDEELKKFIPVSNQGMAKALAGSGAWCIPYLAYKDQYSINECKYNILTLNYIDSLQIVPALFTYLSNGIPGEIRFSALQTWRGIQLRVGAGKYEVLLKEKIRNNERLCIPFLYIKERESDELILALFHGLRELQIERYAGEMFAFPAGYQNTVKKLVLCGNYLSLGIGRQFLGLEVLVLDHFSEVLRQMVEDLSPVYRPQKLILPSAYKSYRMPNGIEVEFDDNIHYEWS